MVQGMRKPRYTECGLQIYTLKAEPRSEWTSICQAEAKAIKTAAMTLLNMNIMNEKIHMYSDLQVVFKALKK